ncbi:MAG: hypothetical protein M3P49_09325 [Actinomycetota bacterium]|nr:hypothetical protein [Actinomycetota bacterium]
MPFEMITCRKCRRCLSGARAHGPYHYYYVTDADGTRHHKWGYPGGGKAAEVPANVKREFRDEADAEYERREANLTEAQRAKRDAVMAQVRDMARLRREQAKRMDAAIALAHDQGDGPREIMRMTDEIEVAHKVERDVLQERFAAEREELEDMLDPQRAGSRKNATGDVAATPARRGAR